MAKNAPAQAELATVKVRLLIDCVFGKVNQVAQLTPEELADAQARGEVDADPAAVAYAESLAAPAEA